MRCNVGNRNNENDTEPSACKPVGVYLEALVEVQVVVSVCYN